MDKMTDDELRAFREHKVAELRHRAYEVRPEQVGRRDLSTHFFLYHLLHSKGIGLHRRAWIRRDTDHRARTAWPEIPARLSFSRKERRFRPNQRTSRWPKLYPLDE